MKHDFRLGDKVTRTSNHHAGMKVGDIATVTKIYEKDEMVGLGGDNQNCHSVDFLRLVKRKGEKTMQKTIWNVMVVNKKTDEVIVCETIIDGVEEKDITAKVGIEFARDLKDIPFENLHFVTLKVGEYETPEKK